MEIEALINKPLLTIPKEINEKFLNPNITLTSFENKNDILKDENLQRQVGYEKFPDGSYLVSMVCSMKNITIDMINWWFWWHPQEDIRYQAWYPVEKIGKSKIPLSIEFVKPEKFGFSKSIMRENDIPLILCGHVGVNKGCIKHTEMAHIFKSTEDGLLLISYFWIGKTLKNKMLRKIVLTDKTAMDMAKHCCIEYRNLVEILPDLYKEYR